VCLEIALVYRRGCEEGKAGDPVDKQRGKVFTSLQKNRGKGEGKGKKVKKQWQRDRIEVQSIKG